MTPIDSAVNPHKASARISLADSADPRRVLADRVEQIYSQMPIGIATPALLGSIGIPWYELRDPAQAAPSIRSSWAWRRR